MVETMARAEPRASGVGSGIGTKWEGAAAPSRLGMAVVFALLGYEWLISGANKVLLGPAFAAGVPQLLRSGIAGNPDGWLARLSLQIVVPHAAILAAAVVAGELAISAGYFVGAIVWARRERLPAALNRWVDPIVIGALLASAVLAMSYAMLDGDGLPLPNPVNAFGPGFSIDLLLALAAGLLLPVQIASALARRRASGADRDSSFA
ncbi:MAG TPA: hypothetical protein VFQ80_13450 [Thermomicrobiales bacterium]|jgi:hypothetical protein|nr:hypothetical protein [Thermomicrobiales bacterium]